MKDSKLSNSASPVLIPIVLFCFIFAVFLPTLAADFIDLDDTDFIVNNNHWKGLTGSHLKWMFTDIFGHYMPLTWLSYALNFAIDRMHPSGYHLVNVLFHCANTVMVCVATARLIRAAMARAGSVALSPTEVRMGAGIAALFWGAHPLRVESVAWITERRDVLSLFFLLGALISYLKFAVPPESPRPAKSKLWYSASIALLLLSLLSKSWGMSFFVIVLMLDWYPLRRIPSDPRRWLSASSLRIFAEKAPHAILGLGFMILAGFAQRSAGLAMRSLDEWPITARLAQSAYGLVFYIWKTIAPTGLSPLYQLPVSVNPLAPKFLVCYGLVAAGIIACVVLWKRLPAFVVAMGVFVVSVAPVLGLLQSGETFVADRYSYVSCIGWSMLLGIGLARATHWARSSERFKPSLVLLGAVAILLCYSVMTMNQAAVWRNSLTLWESTVQGGVTTPAVRVNYGLNLERLALVSDAEGKLTPDARRDLIDRAIEQFKLATEAQQSDGRAWFVLGNSLKRIGKFEEAEKCFAEAAKYLPQAYTAHVNRGRLLIEKLNRPADGIASLRAAVADVERPRQGSQKRVQLSGVPYMALGTALWNAGEKDEAKAMLRKGLNFADTKEGAAQQLRAIGETP